MWRREERSRSRASRTSPCRLCALPTWRTATLGGVQGRSPSLGRRGAELVGDGGSNWAARGDHARGCVREWTMQAVGRVSTC